MPRTAIVGSCGLAFLLTFTATGRGQGGVAWQQLNPTNAPPARRLHAMAYDSGLDRMVLFGGETPAGSTLQDTWEWDGTNWLQRLPATSPPPLRRHKMAYDAARGRTVLFGGTSVGGHLNETWAWDGTDWSRHLPPASPPARFNHALAYDSVRARIVLFGGMAGQTFADTWEWDGATWIQRTPAQAPAARRNHAMAFDAARQRVTLFGGIDATPVVLGDTWEWDGVNWMRSVPTTSPAPRRMHGMAWNAARRRVVLFGGGDTALGFSDTWEWDGVDWLRRVPTVTPSSRARHAMAYDSVRSRVIVFGGSEYGSPTSPPPYYTNTLAYVSLSPASLASYGTGCPGSAGIPTLGVAEFRLPWIGDTYAIELGNLPAGCFPLLALGFNQTSIPIPSLPGCTQLHTADLALALPLNGNAATFRAALPPDPAFVGWQFYLQGAALSAGGNNPLGATSSHAAKATIGMR